MNTALKRSLSCLLFVSALWATPAVAQSSSEFDTVLLSIDTVPSAEELEARWPDALERMVAAANDPALDGYARDRAITLLSVFDEPQARQALEALCQDDDAEVRRLAVYTLGRGFGVGADARLVADVAALTDDTDEAVREYAVRALRWIDHPNARAVLEGIASGNADLSVIATHVLSRRAALFPDEASSHNPLGE